MTVQDTLVHYLERLTALMEKIERHDTARHGILQASLAPDMFPLHTQARIAANFALRACCRLARVPEVCFDAGDDRDDGEVNRYASVREQLDRSREFILALSIPRDPGDSPPGEDTAGHAVISLPMDEYVQAFALPNFFFHLSMVYAIARAEGVPLGKEDFDGYHRYPPGFSFLQ